MAITINHFYSGKVTITLYIESETFLNFFNNVLLIVILCK